MLMLNGNNLKKMFSGETLFENVSFNVYDSDKIGFIGVNGAGKSTLFRIITGSIDSDGGEISKARETKTGYLEQYAVSDGNISVMNEMITVFSEVIEIERQLEDIRIEMENGGDTDELVSRQAVLQERYIALDGMYYRSKIKSALSGLGFSEKDFSLPLCKLSGGQKTRVALCKILLSDANLLLLDEPTNHLDINSREALETALYDYDGTMLMVSHDRYFINRLADRILYLTPDGIIEYSGNYDDFLESRQEASPPEKADEKPAGRGNDYKEKKRLEAEKRKVLNRLAKVESFIEETDNKIAELSQQMKSPGLASDYLKLSEISAQTDLLRSELDGFMEEWETLQRTIEEMGYDK